MLLNWTELYYDSITRKLTPAICRLKLPA